MTKMSPPTPKSLSIVLWRRLKNGCDFGSGGGASGIGLRLLKFGLREQQQYALSIPRLRRELDARSKFWVDRALRRAMFSFGGFAAYS